MSAFSWVPLADLDYLAESIERPNLEKPPQPKSMPVSHSSPREERAPPEIRTDDSEVVESLQRQVSELQSRLRNCQEERDRERQLKEDALARLSHLEGKNLDGEIAKRDHALFEKDRTISELEDAVRDLERKHNDAQSRVQQLHSTIDSHQNELHQKKRMVEEHERTRSRLEAEHKEALARMEDDHRRAAEHHDKRVQHLSSAIGETEEELLRLREELEEKKARITYLEEELAKARTYADAVRYELDEASAELDAKRVWKNVRPTLGLVLAETPHDLGAKVVTVQSGGTAEASGILPNDVLLKVNTVDINKHSDMHYVINTVKPGDVVAVTVRRGMKLIKVHTRMGPLPAQEMDDLLESQGKKRKHTVVPSQAEMMRRYHAKEYEKWTREAEAEAARFRKPAQNSKKIERQRELLDRQRSPPPASATSPASAAPSTRSRSHSREPRIDDYFRGAGASATAVPRAGTASPDRRVRA